METPRIFVSHNHQDNAYCREFVLALRQEIGSDEAVWYDEHNLGWGNIRRVIDRELAQRQHFIAILSPTAGDSDWVNSEIGAAIELLHDGSMQTVQFVVALPCKVPPLLRGYKRVVAPDGQPYPAQEAARRALAVIRSVALSAPTPATSPSAIPAMSTRPASAHSARQHPLHSRLSPISPDHFPQRLASLDFVGKLALVDGKSVEYIVPPLCTVPAGPFLMGSDPRRDKDAYGDEQPQHTVTLPAYQIARYPVTVAEYACFVRAGHDEPPDWKSQLSKLDHPVVNVTWRDALDYAKWLAGHAGQPWRLPTEAEWEKAARGTDGRLYPWSDQFDEARCNTSEGSKVGTTPVGSYPSGASPYDALDMAGNVWEWTSTLFREYPYNEADRREDANSTGHRVLRGGSWLLDAGDARAAFRLAIQPDSVLVYGGFRLVLRAAPIAE